MNDALNDWFANSFPIWFGDAFRWPVIVLGPPLIGLFLVASQRSRHPYKWAVWAGCFAMFTSVGRSIDFLGSGMSYAVVFNFAATVCGYVFLFKWVKASNERRRAREELP